MRWAILGLLMVFAGLFHFNRVSISVAGSERLMSEFSLDETQMGVVYSAYLFVYTLCMIPGGWIIDRFGPKRALMLVGFGSVVLVPLTGLTSLATTPMAALVWLCLVRGLLGMISAPFHPGAARAVSFWFPPRQRTTGNGLITGAAVVGIASTYVVFGLLIDRLTWPWAFAAAGAITLALALVWTIVAADTPRESVGAVAGAPLPGGGFTNPAIVKPIPADARSTGLGDLFSLFKSRSLVLLTLSYAAYSYFQYLFFYWVQYYYDTVLEFSTEESRRYATVTNLSMAAGMVVGGLSVDFLSARMGFWGRKVPPIVGMILSGLLLAAGISVSEPLVVVACFAGATGALGLAEAPFWVTGVELGRARGGLSGAFLNTGGNAGGILAPVLTPLISSQQNWFTGLALAGVICIVGALLWLGISPAREP